MSDADQGASIQSVLTENRIFDPPADFAKRIGGAYISSLEAYRAMHRRSIEDPQGFWGEIAGELDWFQPWQRVCESNSPDARWLDARWFDGGRTNICHNCVDRQVNAGHRRTRRRSAVGGRAGRGRRRSGDPPAVVRRPEAARTAKFRQRAQDRWESVEGRHRHDLHGDGARSLRSRCSLAPESAHAHSVIFGGFSARSISRSPLHLGLDRQAQGRRAHHRRLHGLHRTSPRGYVFDLARRRRLLVHRRHRLGHRPQLHRLRAAGQRRVPTLMYEGAPNHPAGRFWDIVEQIRSRIFYTAPTAIRAFMKWGDEHPRSTTSRACGCSARSASRSTPRPGCGTTEHDRRASAARSSTPGGRPRPAAIMITPLPGATPTKSPAPARCPSSASMPRSWTSRATSLRAQRGRAAL